MVKVLREMKRQNENLIRHNDALNNLLGVKKLEIIELIRPDTTAKCLKSLDVDLQGFLDIFEEHKKVSL